MPAETLLECPECKWRGQVQAAIVHPYEIIRCPLCGAPTEELCEPPSIVDSLIPELAETR